MSKVIKEGLAFDDVLLIPQASDVLPNEVCAPRCAKGFRLIFPSSPRQWIP